MAGYFVSKGVDKFGFGFNFLHKEVQIFLDYNFKGVLIYEWVMNMLLRKVSNCLILNTRPPKDQRLTQVCSIEESWKSFKSLVKKDPPPANAFT